MERRAELALANYSRQEILLPVKVSFIVFSLAMALLLTLLPLADSIRSAWPDFIALVLLYWCINQPRRVGISAAFGMGLLMDIGEASTFGQHALSYTIIAFFALAFHRRLRVFGLLQQAPQIGFMLLLGQFTILLTGLLGGSQFPGWSFFLASATGTLVWPLLASILSIPQRRKANSNVLS